MLCIRNSSSVWLAIQCTQHNSSFARWLEESSSSEPLRKWVNWFLRNKTYTKSTKLRMGCENLTELSTRRQISIKWRRRFELTVRRACEIECVSNEWQSRGSRKLSCELIQASTWQAPINKPQKCSRNQKRIENGSWCRWLRKIGGHCSSHVINNDSKVIKNFHELFKVNLLIHCTLQEIIQATYLFYLWNTHDHQIALFRSRSNPNEIQKKYNGESRRSISFYSFSLLLTFNDASIPALHTLFRYHAKLTLKLLMFMFSLSHFTPRSVECFPVLWDEAWDEDHSG